jgi:ABC-type glycerol-3-phosphate transport system substrate-binding protein
VAEPEILRIWLPPQFNPNANNPAATLLKERLQDFEADHPGLEIDVRIKSESGDADLLNSLAITSMAAPNALPDLIALPRHFLESAAQKGLIKPLDVSGESQGLEWYPYAQKLSEIDGTPYGLPFAGDALVMVYRPDLVWIKSWDDILLSESQLVFAGADPQAETALSLYASAGGELTDAQGKPTLDQDVLVQVLELFSKGRGVSLFPDAAKNISTDDQVLQEYRNQRADVGILHFSKFRPSQDGLYQSLMGLGEEPHFTFSNGWMWTLTGQTPEKQQLARDLAEYLTADEFLAPWILEAGYLPTRRASSGDPVDATVLDVIQSSQPLPTADTVAVLGPLMQEAVARVLNGEEPEAVARSVIENLP